MQKKDTGIASGKEAVHVQEKDKALVSSMLFMDRKEEVLIGKAELDPLYEKAFLSREPDEVSEHAQNTTTWD